MSNKIFIYALRCPVRDEIRYVGKATNVESRYSNHLSCGVNAKKSAWIRWLDYLGHRPELLILEEVGQGEVKRAENEWIAFFLDAGCDLTNAIYPGYNRQEMLGNVNAWQRIARYFKNKKEARLQAA